MAINHEQKAEEYGVNSSDLGIYNVADQCQTPSARVDFIVDVIGKKIAQNDIETNELQYAFLYLTDALDDMEEDGDEEYGDLEVMRARVAQMAENVNVMETEELAFAFEKHGIRAY